MATKSPIEFYDEELSRTFRQIQLAQLEGENPEKLFISCSAYLGQMSHEIRKMPRGQEKNQWTELLKFRNDALKQLQK